MSSFDTQSSIDTASDRQKTITWDEWPAIAREIRAKGEHQDIARLIERATSDEIEGPKAINALGVLAVLAEQDSDWKTAIQYWQIMLGAVNPITTKSRSHVARNADNREGWARSARARLLKARAARALQLNDAGIKHRARDELIVRIVEMMPDYNTLVSESDAVELVRAYVHDGLGDQSMLPSSRAVGRPKRVVFCVDVLGVADENRIATQIIDQSRALLSEDSVLEVHLLVSNECFVVSTPELPVSYSSTAAKEAAVEIMYAMAPHANERFFVTSFPSKGLEGLIETSTAIVEIAPDVIAFGGQDGAISKGSCLLRNCLFDFFPTAVIGRSLGDSNFDYAFERIGAGEEITLDRMSKIITDGQKRISSTLGNL